MSCLGAVAWSAEAFGLGDKSSLFNDAARNANFSSESVSIGDILPPELPELVLGAPVGPLFEAALLDPQFTPQSPPTGDFSGPSLEQVAYNAVQSVIDFGHTSELIPDIGYITGLDQVDPPTTARPAPPLNYPQSGAFTLPEAQSRIDLQAPDFSQLGTKPELRPIEFIPYQLSDLSPLDLSADLPVYEPPAVNALDWQDELKYTDDASLLDTIRELMLGDGELSRWIDGLVQHRLYQSETRTLDITTKRAVDKVMSAAAARNFSLPNGPAEAEVMAAAGEELERSYEASQKIRDEVYERTMNTLTTAIQQALRAEQRHFGLYVRYVRQNLSVYQINLQTAAEAYNTLVQVSNSLLQIVKLRLEAYNQYIAAITDENRASAAQAEFSDAEVTSFLAELRMYDADVGVLRKAVQTRAGDIRNQSLVLDEYQLDLRGVLTNAEVVQQNVSAFKRAIQAHSTSLQWQDDVLASYESAVSAAGSKAGVNQGKFRAYRDLLNAEQTRAGAYERYVGASVGVLDEEIQGFRRATNSQRQYLSSLSDALGDSFSAAGAYASIVADSSRHAGAFNNAKISYTSAKNDNKIATATTEMTQEALEAEVAVQRAKLDAARESAKVTAAGALAQASSTIFGVQLSASGRASESVSGRDSGRSSFSGANRRTYAQDCVQEIRPLD